MHFVLGTTRGTTSPVDSPEVSTPRSIRTFNLRFRSRKQDDTEPQELQAFHATPPDGSSTGSSNQAEPGVHLISELARLVEKWPTLPAHIKAAVMALIATAPSNQPADPKGLDDALPPGFEKRANPGGE